MHWYSGFFVSFLSIFSLWTLTFTTIDFSPLWLLPGAASRVKIILIIFRTTVLAVIVYLLIGLLDDSGMLLSQIRGGKLYNWKAWFYMVLRIALLNGLIILIKYFYDFSAEKARIHSEM